MVVSPWEHLRQPDGAKGVRLRTEICVITPKIFGSAVGETEMIANPSAGMNSGVIQWLTKWQGSRGSVWLGRLEYEAPQAHVVVATANNGAPRTRC
jgi:hypothetical protein